MNSYLPYGPLQIEVNSVTHVSLHLTLFRPYLTPILGSPEKMTVLEDNVQLYDTPLGRTTLKKRKNSDDDHHLVTQPKKLALKIFPTMSNSSPRSNGDIGNDATFATLSNMGNTCFLNSVLYTLRFAPTFLHNLHHLIGDLALVSSRINQNKAKTSSLGRNMGAITGPSSRSTSSKDLLALSSLDVIPKSKVIFSMSRRYLHSTQEITAFIENTTLH